jgi:hypothetical protein
MNDAIQAQEINYGYQAHRLAAIGQRAGLSDVPLGDCPAIRLRPMRQRYAGAVPAEAFARMVAFVISQPDDVDINEILFRPTSQEY